MWCDRGGSSSEEKRELKAMRREGALAEEVACDARFGTQLLHQLLVACLENVEVV